MKKKVLVIGSGGREHALVWKMASSPRVGEVFAAPGNAGTAQAGTNVPIAATNLPALAEFAALEQIDLTIVGPEAPLAEGIVDLFLSRGLPIFGPTKAAAKLEASKAFSKDFMAAHGIPTAAFATFTDYDSAVEYVSSKQWPDGLVVKASGLAAGKGVIICDNGDEGVQALREIMVLSNFGDAGTEVVVEERLQGPELSVLALCDGKTARLLTSARDHKRAFDGDEGPNTGGMGVFGPPAEATPTLLAQIKKVAIDPVLSGMAVQGTPFVGVLFAGLMLTSTGPKVLEYNCRFGDPETQIVLPLLESDLYTLCEACVERELDQHDVILRNGAGAAVVMASPGYPGSYPKGLPIGGLEFAGGKPDTVVFHGGTTVESETLVTSGGRVLAVSAQAGSLEEAIAKAYAGVEEISFEGAHYRKDIGR